jgi:hypothetical protein
MAGIIAYRVINNKVLASLSSCAHQNFLCLAMGYRIIKQ